MPAGAIGAEATISVPDRADLGLQLGFSRAFAPVTYHAVLGWMWLVRGYRIPGLRRIRREARRLVSEGEGPVVICANHLTLIDSFLIIWALAPGWRCVLDPANFPWNLPEKRNFYGNVAVRALCYVGKCIPVVRQGPREETRRVLDKVRYLLGRGESIMIFPEGGRSRTGRIEVDNCSYGVGTILQESPRARVLCVYLRGRGQETYSDFPRRGERFDVRLRMLRPASAEQGLRGAREIARQIVGTLAEMEREHVGRK